ncbi:GC-rich sequence DNA-binding factor 2 isoform X3 [Takifugu flavidus]|uniref:GC-rich sequence DNA-binding factor 2 isoform X3 n=1 Tax=Takifugu flavidus TaxID=433684 RepID=UPI00254435FE|nr:GC-rich sequence DNA-binding factor 2 isoform X3 [Takifugu flavidus]
MLESTIMFNKTTRRNFRQRKETSSEEEDKQENNVDEEEKSEPAQLKTQSRGISCSANRQEKPPKLHNSAENDGEAFIGAEERERREKVKDGTETKTNIVLSFSGDKEVEEPEFKVKKSSDKEVLFQVRKNDNSTSWTSYSTDCNVSQSTFLRKGFSDSQSSAHTLLYSHHEDKSSDNDDDGGSESDGVSSLSSGSDSSRSSVIVSSAQDIQEAPRQHCAMRAQMDFIPLGREGHNSGGSISNDYIRGSDEDRIGDDDEQDDHERRIAFAPRLKNIRQRILAKLEGSDDSLSSSDEREQQLWEETQLGKGVKRHLRVLPNFPHPCQSSAVSESSTSSSGSTSRSRQKKRSKEVRIPKTFPPIVSVIKKKIVERLDSLTEVHRTRQTELRKLEADIEWAQNSVETLVEISFEKRLHFFRSLALFVHTLTECLQEKVVEINALELELHVLLSEQWGALLNRRRHKVTEQADCLQHLSFSTDEQSGNRNNGTETQWEIETGVECNKVVRVLEDTEVSEEEDEQLQKMKDDILLRSQAVFSSVQDEFYDVKKILSHFEEWRGSYTDSYHSAYISFCLPKLLSPIIRHQLLVWNPLKDDSEAFEKLPWFTAVETFCHGYGHEELEHSDRQTLSDVVEKTVLPKITAYVELAWDPESSHQSVCLFGLCHKLKEDFSIFDRKQSKPVKAFVEAVISRLRSTVDEDVFIPLYPKKVLDDPSSPQCHFRDQQFWKAIKLFVNIGKWDLLLPESALKELMLDKLLNRYLMITLCSQTLHGNAVQACRKVVDSLPLSWLKGETECLPQLQNFRNHLVQKIHTIFKQHSLEDPNTRSAVVELLQILSTIRCNDSIMAIAQKYQCEDVIYSHQLLNQETV